MALSMMTSRMKTIATLVVFALALVSALPAASASSMFMAGVMQAPPHSEAATPPATEAGKEPQESSQQSKELKESAAGKEAAEKTGKKEGESEAVNQSPAVKAIARLTGLDVEKAYWLCTIFNFLAVVAVLGILMRRILPALFRNRTDAIQKRMEEARKTGEDARRRLTGVEERLSKLDAEIAQMRSEADSSGKSDEERVMKTVEDERRRIVESAEQEIAMAANTAQRELRAFVAGLAVELAEKKIDVGKAADQALVREFTARLGKEQ